MGSDLRSTLVIREMKFYCIDAQRFTALSDDSIRDLVYSARHAHFQVRYFLCLCTEHGIELHLTEIATSRRVLVCTTRSFDRSRQ